MLYFLSHPIQYISPLLKSLANETNLEVIYYSDISIKGGKDKDFGRNIKWDIPLLDGYSFHFLKNYSWRKINNNNFFDVINPGIIWKLWNTKEKIIVVNGWSYSTDWLVFFFGKLFGKKIWLRSETPLNQEIKKSKRILFLKKIVLKIFLFNFFIDKFLFIGTQNKAFYKYYGVDDMNLIYTPYAVDNKFFNEEYLKLSHLKDILKNELNIPLQNKVILFVGKYIDKKRPLDLLNAFNNLNNDKYSLIMVGEGEKRGEMEEFINNQKLKNIRLTGFINQTQISKYYSIADVFVMCSGIGETWGLSVNEAMNFSLPVVVSKTCGSSYDLVKDGINGFVFEEGNIDQLTQKVLEIIQFPEKCLTMGKKSLEIIKGFSISLIVSNLIKEN